MAYGRKMNPGVGPVPPGRKRPRRPVRGGYGGGMDNRGGSRMMRNPGIAPRPSRRGMGPSPRKMRPPVGPGTGIGGGPRPLPRPRPRPPIIGRPPYNRLNKRDKIRY